MDLEGSSPIHHGLNRGKAYRGIEISIEPYSYEDYEALYWRIFHKDPTAGCLDPDVLSSGQARDEIEVTLKIPQCNEPIIFRMYTFLAHLVTTATLEHIWDEEEEPNPPEEGTDEKASRDISNPTQRQMEQQRLERIFADGTWAGSLMWDSAVHTAELLVKAPEWRARVEGAVVVELGCGLALPGIVCHELGARAVVLTDRSDISALVTDNINRSFIPAPDAEVGIMYADELEWTAADAHHLKMKLQHRIQKEESMRGGTLSSSKHSETSTKMNRDQDHGHDHEEGCPIDIILACDCVFAPLYGDTFPLLQILLDLATPNTRAIVACERRKDDGIEDFLESARGKFQVELLHQLGDEQITIHELRLIQ